MVGKKYVITTVLLGAMLFASGFFAYAALVPSRASSEHVGIGGDMVLKAYHSDGRLFATVHQHNTLGSAEMSLLAACWGQGTFILPSLVGGLPGTDLCNSSVTGSTPPSIGSLGVSAIGISSICTGIVCIFPPPPPTPIGVENAKDAVVPSGCAAGLGGPAGTPPCTGWTSTATLDCETSGTTDCTITGPVTVGEVDGFGPFAQLCTAPSAGICHFPFDTISTSIAIAPGDRLAITITYSIT